MQRFERFVPESQLLADLLANRDRIMTEITGHLQEIVKCLGDQENETYSSRFRMADFASFALKIACCQGWGEQMDSILRKLADEQTSFTIEGEPVFDLLETWLARDNGKNAGREVTSADLCRELARIAENNGIEFWYKDKTRAFAQRLRNLKSSLQKYFVMSERKGSGRKRFLSFLPRNSEGRPDNGA